MFVCSPLNIDWWAENLNFFLFSDWIFHFLQIILFDDFFVKLEVTSSLLDFFSYCCSLQKLIWTFNLYLFIFPHRDYPIFSTSKKQSFLIGKSTSTQISIFPALNHYFGEVAQILSVPNLDGAIVSTGDEFVAIDFYVDDFKVMGFNFFQRIWYRGFWLDIKLWNGFIGLFVFFYELVFSSCNNFAWR